MPERRVKWLGAVGISLSPLILAACARNAQPDSQEPIYNDTPISQPTAEQASAQNPEPVNQNSTIIIEGNGKKFEILPDITIEKLLQSATELKKNAPDVKDVEFFIRNASLKFTQNPNDPNISQDILFASDVLFTQSQACNQPQLEVGEKARELTQQMASYLYVNYPSIWSVRGAPFLDGPCDWSKEESDALVGTKPTATEPENTESNDPRTRNRGFFVTFSPFLEQVIILEQGRKYELSYDAHLETLLGEGNFGQVLAENIDPETFSRVTSTDASDPNHLNILKEAAAAIENEPNGQLCKTDQRQFLTQRNLVRALASAAYTLDYENWDTNKQAFFNSCFWGQTGDFQTEYNTYANSGFFTTKDGLRLYKKISWEMVNNQQLFDRLEADLSDPEVQRIIQPDVNTIGVADRLRDAYARASAYASDPDSQEFDNIMTLDGYALNRWCRVSPAAREIMRRSASFIYLNTSEQNWSGYERFNLGGCRNYLDQEQIGSTTKIFERFEP